MSEPATTAGVMAWALANAKWLLFVAIPALCGICVDWLFIRRSIKNLEADNQEIKQDMKELLACSRENGKKIAILETKLDERTGK